MFAGVPLRVRAIRITVAMLATVHPEHDEKARRTAIEFQSIESAHLYNNFPWPCRSALNLPYSLRYLAFSLSSLMPSPAL
jgi:hypothetical protein